MANEGDFLFGLKFNFDPSGFLRGSAEAQDQLERTVAAIISAKEKTESEVNGLASALSRSPQQVRAALRELERAERDHGRQMEQQRRATERRQGQQQREDVAHIRNKTQAVSQLRDALLSVAAITMGGAGLSGINSLLQETSTRGVEERAFAQRTGTNIRRNIAEEEGAYLSGMSSREEARQSISAYANAQSQYRLTGESGLSTALLRSGVSITPDQMLNMSHERFVSYVVGQLRGLGYNDQLTSTILEQSGLTSGGYTNLALHPDQMRRFNQQGEARANDIASNTQRDLEFQQAWRHMSEDLSHAKDTIAHDLDPWVKQFDHLFVALDGVATHHPTLTKDILAATTVVVALGGLLSAAALMIGPALAIMTLNNAVKALSASGAPAAANVARAAAAAAPAVGVGEMVVLGGALAGATAIAGYSVYNAYREISHDLSDSGRLEGNRTAIRDPFYSANRYSPLEQNQKEYEVLSHLIRDKHYTPEQAAAVAAMARSEGGFNERALGDGGTAEGVFQWHKDRRKAIEEHFGRRLSSMSLIEQVDAYDWELHNSERAAAKQLFSSRDLGGAVKGGLDSERPLEYLKHGVSGAEYARRYGMAERALKQTRGIVSRSPAVVAGGGNTTLHIQNVNVKANNAHQMVGSIKQAAGLPNAHAVAANTGVH